MPIAGWRWLLALSALPSLAFVLASMSWMPESARFNAARGRNDEALDTLGKDLIDTQTFIHTLIFQN